MGWSKVQFTLYGEDADWFDEYRRALAARRDGNEPDNAEVVRRLMEATDPKSL